jgi:hypothetical protein
MAWWLPDGLTQPRAQPGPDWILKDHAFKGRQRLQFDSRISSHLPLNSIYQPDIQKRNVMQEKKTMTAALESIVRRTCCAQSGWKIDSS